MANIYLPTIDPIIQYDKDNNIKKVFMEWLPYNLGVNIGDAVYTPIFSWDNIIVNGVAQPFPSSRAWLRKRGSWGTVSLDIFGNNYNTPTMLNAIDYFAAPTYTTGASVLTGVGGFIICPTFFGRIIVGSTAPAVTDTIGFTIEI